MNKKEMVRVQGLYKTFVTITGSLTALKKINLTIHDGEFSVLLGPSGCGKTTMIRCIAGLEQPEEGKIWIGDHLVFSSSDRINVPPEQRNLGMVFQSYAIWPHLDVYHNVGLPLMFGMRRIPRKEVRARVLRALEQVHLEKMERREATELSGGQQQRVALARALACEPRLLLMDEPLSNLDARLREEMRFEITSITSKLGITTLYVTHDQSEALVLADKITIMSGGTILQEGLPREIHSFPNSLEVAEFLGDMNFIRGIKVEGSLYGPHVVKTNLGLLVSHSPREVAIGKEAMLGFRQERGRLSKTSLSGKNVIRATLVWQRFLGNAMLYELNAGEVKIRVKTSDFLQADYISSDPSDLFLILDPKDLLIFQI